ncbi:MAG: putative ABC transport system permease protein [Cyclobacteriaceae bacterium]|jgi:putative ABC transport system permease protein
MNLLQVSWKNVTGRPLSSSLSILILALGVSLITVVFRISDQLKENFTSNMTGIDMVVGAKGSPLQLILSAVFHIDVPTGNIPLLEAQSILKNRYVKRAIPLSYGDSYQGYRIIGTDISYLNLYKGVITAGQIFSSPLEVVLGAKVAEFTQLVVGDTFESAHGLETEGMKHDKVRFKVVGLISVTGTVLDQLIITPTESVWEVHDNHSSDIQEETLQEITALLVKFASPMGLIQLPRFINSSTSMQAALPAYEISKLFSLLGIGIDILYYIAYLLVGVAGLSLWITMTNALKERHYELALMRTYGATKSQIFISVIQESLMLGAAGFIAGYSLGQLGLAIINPSLVSEYGFAVKLITFDSFDLTLSVAVFSICFISALTPAIRASRKDISATLSDK